MTSYGREPQRCWSWIIAATWGERWGRTGKRPARHGDSRVSACLAAAFVRTMSPLSAVVIYGAGLVGVALLARVRRLLPDLLSEGGGGIAYGPMRGSG
jgi:hypothetical protein